ncbi:MAG: hypothetical protein ABIQ11_03005, partial [Saprospiraceae bacterium]
MNHNTHRQISKHSFTGEDNHIRFLLNVLYIRPSSFYSFISNLALDKIQVFKFGGASVKDAGAIKNVGTILQATAHRPLAIVISAMGKTTNALEDIIRTHYNQPENLPGMVEKLKNYHEEISIELLQGKEKQLLNDLHDLWVELNWILEEDPHPDYNYHYDQIIVFGELASTKIVSAYLDHQQIKHQWLDARSFIKTDSGYREARIQ